MNPALQMTGVRARAQAPRPPTAPCMRRHPQPMNPMATAAPTPTPTAAPAGYVLSPALDYPATSFELAVPVRAPPDEYAWLQQHIGMGWEFVRQSLTPHRGRMYDVIRVRMSDHSEHDYYFDISDIWLARLRAAQAANDGAACGCARPAGDLDLNVTNGQLQISTKPAQRCSLPSGDSACALMAGDWRALPTAVMHTLGRSLLIALGIAAAGERDPVKIVKGGLFAALSIEAFALVWASMHQPPPTR